MTLCLCLLLHFFLLQDKLALKKQFGLTLCQVVEILEAVPTLLRHRLRNGRAQLQRILDRNAAAAHSHERRHVAAQPP